MKRFQKALLFSAMCLLLSSCVDDVFMDPTLLIGKWESDGEFYRYDSDGTGVTWDTKDDVYEDEAQPFKWEFNQLDRSLTHIHWMEMTQDWTVPRVYTVTMLNDSVLKYDDRFGKSYSFTRVE